jgi:hypothetical protein
VFNSGCKLKDDSVVEPPTPPNITRISVFPGQISVDKISAEINPEDVVDTTIIVSIVAGDINSDLSSLKFAIISPAGLNLSVENSMLDNGAFPDTTASDGVFSGKTNITFKKKELGSYSVQVHTSDANGFNILSLASLEVVNPLVKIPQVSNLFVADTTFIPTGMDSVMVLITAKAIDPQGLENINTVLASILSTDGEYGISISLYDDGGGVPVPPYSVSSGDATAGDSVFSMRVSFTKKLVTDYLLSVVARDKDGVGSNSISTQFAVRNQSNGAPLLFGIEMQDTAVVPTTADTNYLKVAITADDPEGLDDLYSVYFTSVRPNNTVVGVYQMYDDGNTGLHQIFQGYEATSGDDFANDAVFTVTIPIFQGTDTGTYRDFIFQARDRAGETSVTLTKRVHLK